MRSISRSMPHRPISACGRATVVRPGSRASATGCRSSMPMTDSPSGRAMPRRAAACMTPIAIWSLKQMIAVGGRSWSSSSPPACRPPAASASRRRRAGRPAQCRHRRAPSARRPGGRVQPDVGRADIRDVAMPCPGEPLACEGGDLGFVRHDRVDLPARLGGGIHEHDRQSVRHRGRGTRWWYMRAISRPSTRCARKSATRSLRPRRRRRSRPPSAGHRARVRPGVRPR